MAALIELIEGFRAVNAGALEMARIVETLTPMLIAINVRYKARVGDEDHRSPGRRSLEVSEIERCVVLAGGTGGAKLAAGMQDLLGEGLAVIANTADDVELLGVDVSPDPDLITYWLAGEIDEERGWGIKDDSFTAFERLVALGAPDWFSLSDRDLATCLYRRSFVAEGGRRTDAQAQIARSLGVRAAVLPMCEQPVRTRVRTAEGWRGLQEFLIVDHAQPAIEEIELEGIAEAEPTPEVAGGDLRGRGDRHRSLEPGDLDRPDPRRRRPPRGAGGRRRPGARGQPLRGGRGRQGAHRRLHVGDRASLDRSRGRLALSRA